MNSKQIKFIVGTLSLIEVALSSKQINFAVQTIALAYNFLGSILLFLAVLEFNTTFNLHILKKNLAVLLASGILVAMFTLLLTSNYAFGAIIPFIFLLYLNSRIINLPSLISCMVQLSIASICLLPAMYFLSNTYLPNTADSLGLLLLNSIFYAGAYYCSISAEILK